MDTDTLILGAGAAGLYLAGLVPDALVLDHAARPAEKVRISGGGAATSPTSTPARCLRLRKPPLRQVGPGLPPARDFVALVDRHRIPWHEKTLGQLFCDRSSKDIIAMLLAEAARAGATVRLSTAILSSPTTAPASLWTPIRRPPRDDPRETLVVATGGKSIPKMGATGLAYRVASQFGLRSPTPDPALVPFTFPEDRFAPLAGVAVPVAARAATPGGGPAFAEAMLFTHRGLSGPAMLQASTYWREGDDLSIALLPALDWQAALRRAKRDTPRQTPRSVLARHLPARLADHLSAEHAPAAPLAEVPDARLDALAAVLSDWRQKPSGTEGWRTAEVTLGGVDTAGLSSKTMQAKAVPGLFFIGECVDVTGWLGGYNFQWAWSSAHAAARALRP
jgi:predicted Rossmann fold flavoprotein